MPHELTKPEKKIARLLIDKGVNAEFRKALELAAEILTEWQNGSLDNRAAYHKLFKKIQEQDKIIGQRYDGLRGSDYLLIVARIYADGQITDEDINDFSEDTKVVLNTWLQFMNEEE